VASTLAELESDHAYAALRAIAFEPLPAIAQSSHHLDPALQNQVIVRMVTIDGLAALAKHGNERAEADLWDMASATEHAVPEALRAVAVKGYLASGDDYAAREQRLTRSLPKGLHWAVTLERPTAQDVNDLGQRVASALPPVDMRPNEAIEPQEQPLN
jgi:hypothetical protein